MMTLYRTESCSKCDDVEEALKRLSLAYSVKDVSEGASECPQGASAPVLVDENKLIAGHDAVMKHIDHLEKYKREWDKYQSDACYGNE